MTWRLPLVPRLPPPSGEYALGTILLEIEGAREVPFGASRTHPARAIRFWYPAEPGTGDGLAPYRPTRPPLLAAERLMTVAAAKNALLSQRAADYPVILSFPGWAGSQHETTAFTQDLASRGFVVVTIGYDDLTLKRPGGSVAAKPTAGIDFSSQAAIERTLDIASQKIEYGVARAGHVLNLLTDLAHRGSTSRFSGRLDLARAGVVGYSLGGAMAMTLGQRDERLKAAVNVDGWAFDAASHGPLDKQVLYISDDSPAPTQVDRDSPDPERRYVAFLNDATERRVGEECKRGGGVRVTIAGSAHDDFSDAPYLSRAKLLSGRASRGDAVRLAVDHTAAFFDRALGRGAGAQVLHASGLTRNAAACSIS